MKRMAVGSPDSKCINCDEKKEKRQITEDITTEKDQSVILRLYFQKKFTHIQNYAHGKKRC